MYKRFKEKINKSVYMPVELINKIQDKADNNFSNFNKVVVEVLIKEFLMTEKNK